MGPFDRCLCWTSLYVLVAALHVQNRLIYCLMVLQTIFSVCHWSNYQSRLYRMLDRATSTTVFCSHLFFFRLSHSAWLCAFLSCIFFGCRSGTRELAEKNKCLAILPHASFRFFGFWFVMFANDQCWSTSLSMVYWITVFALLH